ncbi:hypothetical protein PQX77_011367 [Marasmius sp. AFHP31]|nr:hypothetical protein PQX77_011367 [Marasmius sp. AFHP31]
MSLFRQVLLYTSTLSSFLLSSHAKTITRYIDDTYGDPVTRFKPSYYPTGDKIWQDQTCGTIQGCSIVPDTNLSHNGTFTAATYKTSMSNGMGFNLIFRGTSITVYFILANDDYTLPTTTRTECNFILNGILEKSYIHTPAKNKGTEYNVTVFKKEELEDRVHTLDIGTGKKDHEVFLAFDYATYTVEEPDGTTTASPSGFTESDSKSSLPTGAIVGGVIGALVLIGCALVVFFLCRRRRNAKINHDDIDAPGNNIQVAPYMAQAQPKHGFGSPAKTQAPIPIRPRLSKQASLMQRQQLDRMKEELTTLKSSRGHAHAPRSDSGMIRSGEVAELREQIRELRAQMRMYPTRQQQEGQKVVDTPPPMYTM